MKKPKIVFADTTEVDSARESMDKLLLLVGRYMGWDGDISHVFVSDESTMGDFSLDPDELKEISDQLGFAVSESDYLKDIALKIRGTC